MSWVERVLEDWGAWRRAQGDAQGWGGALELDRLFQLCKTRDPGVHSDPVGSEFAATDHGEEAGRRAVDRYVRLCGPEPSLTAQLRYVGIWLPVEGDAGYKDRAKLIALEGCPRRWDMGMEIYYRETCLTAAQIAEAMQTDTGVVLERLKTVRDTVRLELLQDANNRKKDRAARRKAA